jgi:hypothetical protein
MYGDPPLQMSYSGKCGIRLSRAILLHGVSWSCEVVKFSAGRKSLVHLTEENNHWSVVEAFCVKFNLLKPSGNVMYDHV